MKEKNTYIALLVTFLWGSMFPIVKIGYSLYNVTSTGDLFFFAGIRFIISSIITTFYAVRCDKVSFSLIKKSMPLILLTSLIAVIAQNVFTYPALKLTLSSNAAILKQSSILLYIGFSFLFFKDDKPTLCKVIGVVLGFSGIVVMNYTSQGISINFGNILMICASLCIMISSILYKKLFVNIPPLTSTAITQFIGGCVLAILGTVLGGKLNVSNISSLWLLAYLGVMSSVSYALWYTVVKKAQLSKLFIIKLAEPIFSCLFAAIFLEENIMTIRHLLAVLLIFSGICISNRK